jgi:hypothetical protein
LNQWRAKPKKQPKFPKECGKFSTKKRPIDQSYSEIEKKLDSAFSQWIRLLAASGNGLCTCVTCGSMHHWKELDNGHYISRALRWTRWETMNCEPQCKKCNRYLDGQKHVFRRALVDQFGEETIARMEREATQWGEKKIAKELMLEKLDYYRAEVRKLRKEKGIC